jgi:drug/metabolite transporter (DMT)-like permease
MVLGATALAAVPVTLLVLAGKDVGEDFQPRYLLPLIVVFIGSLFFTQRDQVIRLSRAQVWLVVAALSGAQFIALHLNIRRYVTGIDALNANLDAGREWWWALLITPNIVWIVGSLCFAAALAVLLPRCRTTADIGPEVHAGASDHVRAL